MFELTDQAFTLVQPLLPANSRRGKPARLQLSALPALHPPSAIHALAITDEASPFALRSTRNHPRRARHHGCVRSRQSKQSKE
jgi:hypothetical protein